MRLPSNISMDVYNVLQCALLVLTAVTGDYFVHLQQHHDVGRAFSDNATHAAVGFLTWITMISHLGGMPPIKARILVQSLLCALISSAIDVDHFISARSFHLKDATKLIRRPFLHCTTLPLVAFLVIFIPAKYCNCVKLETLGWIILAAFLSHHIRDAARRGFWFYPLGSTPPLGTGTYLALTAILPIFLSLILHYTDSSLLKMQSYKRSVLIV